MVLRPTLPVPLLLGLALGACNLDPFHLGFDEDAGPTGDARAGRADGGPGIGYDGGFVFGDGGILLGDGGFCDPDTCNNQPDHCGFDFMNDPSNCGGCNVRCDQAALNQLGKCVQGQCSYDCIAGYHDCDGQPGCETFCIPTNGGVEICDGIDNNCNCQVDEGFNTSSDPMNCGACGHVCTAINAMATCVNGTCGLGACNPGYKHFDPTFPGCEYKCPYWPPKSSDTTCDGIDDDCNGKIDDGVPGIGQACDTGLKGPCAAGVFQCANGAPACMETVFPMPEVCNGKDDDCDGVIDNGFDKQNDPNHCGDSCAVCSFPNAIPGCQAGKCVILACQPGWTNLHSNTDPRGCDYHCTPTGPEVCDGIDNDCNGLVDAADPGLIQPPQNFCNQRGVCAGTTPTCSAGKAACNDTAVGWRCNYKNAEVDSCGNLLPVETLCDGLDGNCNGAVDDGFPNLGQPCSDGKLGICRSSGSIQCDPSDPKKASTKCIITSPGQSPRAETCNGLDDDCDGVVDNPGATADHMVLVKAAGGVSNDFCIQQYEASHPDASGSDPGHISDHACANPLVLPWNLVSWTDANAACSGSGKRLCTEAEWQLACGGAGGSATTYPYGNAYQPNTCNGLDYDPNCTPPDDNIVLATGTPMGCPTKPAQSACFKDLGNGAVYDMSGNLREWTSQLVGTSPNLRRIRGGAFDNVGAALTCSFNFWAETEDSDYYNLGFRCCADVNSMGTCAPGN